MSGTSETPPLITVGEHGDTGPRAGGHEGVPTNKRVKRLTGTDRVVVALMVAVPLLLTTIF